METTFFILCILFFLGLTFERVLLIVARRRIPYIIHVNGTRGKSSVVRLISAGLRAGGIQTISKTTGTLPCYRDTDGAEHIIRRIFPANIREQRRFLFLAARRRAVLIIECMAIAPEYQRASEAMLQSNIAVFTNARLDHTDMMGETLDDVSSSLLSSLPKRKDSACFTADPLFFKHHLKPAHKNSYCVTAQQNFETEHFNENVALALEVCNHLGIPSETARAGMLSASVEPYSLCVYKLSDCTFINGFSINDPESSINAYHAILNKYDLKGDLTLVLNMREDRPQRAEQMLSLILQLAPKTIILIGQLQPYMKRKIMKLLNKTCVICCKDINFVPLDTTPIVFAVGNIKGQGMKLIDRVEKEAL